MTDKQLMAGWRRIRDPIKALRTLRDNQTYIGTDPYYRDLNDTLWKMVDTVLEEYDAKEKA